MKIRDLAETKVSLSELARENRWQDLARFPNDMIAEAIRTVVKEWLPSNTNFVEQFILDDISCDMNEEGGEAFIKIICQSYEGIYGRIELRMDGGGWNYEIFIQHDEFPRDQNDGYNTIQSAIQEGLNGYDIAMEHFQEE